MNDAHAREVPPALVVVIAAYNCASTLDVQLAALCGQECPVDHEVVVVDNASTDGTAGVVASWSKRHPEVRLVSATGGRGAGYARNVGLRESQSPWVAFCDADDAVGTEWLTAVCAALIDHPFVTGPLETGRLNEPWLARSRGAAISSTQPVFEGVFPIASSCNLAAHREVLESVEGFDESFLIGQDTELSLRLWRSGTALHFNPGMVVHYRYRPSLSAVFAQARRFGRAHAAIVAELHPAETAKIPSGQVVRRTVWLVRRVPLIGSREGRARWLYVLGTQIGRIEGRVRR